MQTILVVEDDADIAEFLQDFLPTIGYAVVVATTGVDTFTQLHHTRPVAILSDFMMPEMDGRDLCQRLAQHDDYRTIPFILMSVIEQPLRTPAYPYAAYVRKPFRLKTLQAVLEHTIKRT